MKHFVSICFILLVAACSQPAKQATSVQANDSDTIRYATGFTVERFDDFISVEVIDPWNTTQVLQRYLLVERGQALPGNLPKGTVVRVPLRKIAVYTSVHASIIDQLGEADKIIGVCEPQYMDSPTIQEGLQSGRIVDLGMATSPNVEKMIDIDVEYIIASPFQNSNYGQAEKIGIPIIEAADYMEPLPLGRAEWGRFYGLLFQKEAMADSIFRDTEERYLALKSLAKTATKYPTVLSEKRYGSFWYISGNDSYIAHFFKDASADYIFKDIPGSGSTPLAFETVLDQAMHADIWLMKYNQTDEMTYKSLRDEYTPYENFDAWKNRNIYTCNTGKVPYYEEFPIHPDYLLEDLIWVFHPELLPDYTPRYYQKME
ncbi:iron complex transport system substrate-binding protein [Parabacteroides sp. PF5-5]|uniref:ABC transporter substrate-binding protein n=1 Tax=unclassified Parabacteroides TaxID=2649774 RepID=UPI002476BF77|nr:MULTISPECIES: ABC transporter substrate-binding protein [unclassified Parabacteroides]MDH6304941.1 iron complex transport system substrate-binding protein [Parabacteroides sp. PH5-39]MDH6315973.1 iron complex transport system substrate-binding protein [Parabacteroides sp. PF5-13]MDH6319630.1 iron complex transport system substrate-binding protein [Parabacteroides sp. PH5-13]MDH6323361.1 iron complex transport system substrate-binding protein [Parabacteroides sp. PH5-8]MDH6327130.1 iron comp